MGRQVKQASTMVVLVLSIAVALAGCGGSNQSQKTARTDLCLKISLVERYLNTSQTCADTTVLKSIGSSYKVNVICAHQGGDQYVCQTSTYEPIDGQRTSQTYQVTNDGKNLIAEPTS